MSEWTRMAVGDIVESYIGSDEIRFEYDKSGAMLTVAIRNLDEVVESFRADSSFQIRYTKLKNVLVLLFKFGDLPWMDAPYSPNLYTEPLNVNLIKEG